MYDSKILDILYNNEIPKKFYISIKILLFYQVKY